jgi:DNA-binding NarL/FixJ family response regulator
VTPPTAEEPIRVMIVDDHAVVRRGLFAFLGEEPDLEVVGDAADGEEALRLLAELDAQGSRPDVVMMDLQMAPMDGVESTRRIRELYDDVEVVALSSFSDQERVYAALQAGASGYLLKDADADDVAAAVRAAHRGQVQLDPAVALRLAKSLADTRDRDATTELTPRELDVLRLVAAGEPNKLIADALGIGERTVRSHVSSILAKLNLKSRTQAALWATREGITDLAALRGPNPSA